MKIITKAFNKLYQISEYLLCFTFLFLLVLISLLIDDSKDEEFFISPNLPDESNEKIVETNKDLAKQTKDIKLNKETEFSEIDWDKYNKDESIKSDTCTKISPLEKPAENSIADNSEDLGLKHLFHEKVPLKDFFEFDMMYYEIQNVEAYINNGAIEIKIISDWNYCVKPSFIRYITKNIDIPNDKTFAASENLLDYYMKSLMEDYRREEEVNRDEYNELDKHYAKVPSGSSSSSPSPSDSENPAYEELVRAIISGKNVTVYEENSRGKISSLEEWTESSSSSSEGDWSKLEPLTGFIKKEGDSSDFYNARPKQIIFISNKNADGESIIPLPNLSNNDSSSDNLDKNIAIKKAWAKKYPFFPEHYAQMGSSSQEAQNQAWWLSQQDNSLKWDQPGKEDDESYYLEELFEEKESKEKNN